MKIKKRFELLLSTAPVILTLVLTFSLSLSHPVGDNSSNDQSLTSGSSSWFDDSGDNDPDENGIYFGIYVEDPHVISNSIQRPRTPFVSNTFASNNNG